MEWTEWTEWDGVGDGRGMAHPSPSCVSREQCAPPTGLDWTPRQCNVKVVRYVMALIGVSRRYGNLYRPPREYELPDMTS